MNNTVRTSVRLLLPMMLFIVGMARCQTFSLFVSKVYSSPEQNRPALVDSFLRAVPSFPFVENDSTAHFLYRGSASSVAIAGDANNWSGSAGAMQRLSSTDLWYLTEHHEPDARLDYKIIADGNWMLDPRNPRAVVGGFGPNSELVMPKYVDPPEIVFTADIPHGTLIDTTLASVALGNSRRVRIYLPAEYEQSSNRYPVALFHDGFDYLNLGQANNVLDYLIARKAIPPVIAVFVPPVDRATEYTGSRMPEFSLFIIDDVIGYVDRRFRTQTAPSARATIGASNGGNISFYLSGMHSDVFGLVAAQSSNILPVVADRFAQSPRLPLKIHLDVGTYDIPVITAMARAFAPTLALKGYEHVYREYHEGHSWGNWRAHLDDALIFLFGAGATDADSKSALSPGFRLDQNYPNPFPDVTTIPFSLGDTRDASLRISDVSGAMLKSYELADSPTGDVAVLWDARGLPPGFYLFELHARKSVARRIMIKL
jgi:enterochelin esterase-like enzyme